MIDRLKTLFTANHSAAGTAATQDDDVRRATATLLFMAASMDDHIDAAERAVIAEAVAERFDLAPDEANALLVEAEETAHDSTHFQRFTQQIKNAFDDAGRFEVMEMLWRVICVDGEVHHREANLMRRIAGLLYVTDKDSGLARQRALATIGAGDSA